MQCKVVPISVTSVQCRKVSKDAFKIVRFQDNRLTQTKSALNNTKTELVAYHKTVIDLQENLLESKETHLKSVQTVRIGIKDNER